ncbi:hypothetical protein IC229_28965 [Spirosoma sp. BT702]|uniref:Uncharacterized protein n=1 Tax=Spirosoma profusum TaxID=2771354 RepID=A0A927AUK9_9BACT|nr:hypothetical protein [Spirosoma profusum]MBD2704702.1 hypothetical protein [Spirosoma profusum]
MSAEEKMRQDGWKPSGRDPDIIVKDGKEMLIDPKDRDFVKPYGWGTYKQYGSDDHHQ